MRQNTLLLITATLAAFAASAHATSIFIENANFNDQVIGSETFVGGVQDWPTEVGGTAPVTSTQTATFPTASIPGGGPNVPILGDFNGGFGYIFQTLATAWAADTTYTLTFYVGHGANLTYEGYLVSLAGGSTDPTIAGPTILASDNTGIAGIAAGTFAQDSLTFSTGAIAPAGDITIELGTPPVAGGTGFALITLDAVTNSSVPEPAAWIMVAAGLGLLAFQRLRPFRAATIGSGPAGLTRSIRASAPAR